MDSLTCSFNPFFSKTLKGSILFPKLPIRPIETCSLCGKEFRPKNRLQKYCSPKCQKYLNNRSEATKAAKNRWKRIRKKVLSNAIKEMNSILGKWEKREVRTFRDLGTYALSMDLGIIEVNGQKRIRAAVWLENEQAKASGGLPT